MDKQKQIEEMAKILLETSCKGSECENCAFVKSVKEARETCVCLKALYNAGYCKIPENAVVLTREEYLENGDMYIDGKMEMQRYYDEVEIPKVKKEMAEKFTDFAKSKIDEYKKMSLQHREKGSKDRECYYLGKEKSMEEILELCKKILEGVK